MTAISRCRFFGSEPPNGIEERIETLLAAEPLSNDEVLLRTNARLAQAIARQLQILNAEIKDYDREIKRLVQSHADFPIVQSLPGASDKTQARIIAALGDDRNRYESAEALQNAAGISPLSTQSGQSKYVSRRWASTTFMMQTFHEYAGLSITRCKWAKAFYDSQIEKGNSANMAKRALAYKWLRIIHRCWINRKPYDEAQYLARLAATGSHLSKKLNSA